MKKVTQVVLLAGGGSSRFYPFNSLGHKSLVVLCGKPLIVHTLVELERRGFKHVLIVEGAGTPISKAISVSEFKNLTITFVTQKKPLGMGDALVSCKKELDPQFFLLNAYHFEAVELLSELQSSVESETDIAVLTKEEEDASEFGSIVKKDGKVQVVEKNENNTGGRIIGVYLLNTRFVDILKTVSKHEYSFEDAISGYSKMNTVVLVDAKNPTFSLKFPWNILDAKDFALNMVTPSISKSAKISKSAEIEDGVVIEEGAKIMENAAIKGRAYIGKNALIGNNAVIRDGVCIEEGAIIGANMEIKNAVIMKHTTTHSGFIGDSVIGEHTKIAAGFNTANVRLDRGEISSVVKNKKVGTTRKALGVLMGSHNSVGIKVGTMPGIIIGDNNIIGPGTTVMENIPDDTSYYTEFKKIVKK